jgi:hypothetical protein
VTLPCLPHQAMLCLPRPNLPCLPRLAIILLCLKAGDIEGIQLPTLAEVGHEVFEGSICFSSSGTFSLINSFTNMPKTSKI